MVLAGDDFVRSRSPVSASPLLIEVAAGFDAGTLDPLEIVEREAVGQAARTGLWQHLKAPALPLADLAVLAAAAGDGFAANALLARVGLDAVRARIECSGCAARPVLDDARSPRPRRRAVLRAGLRAGAVGFVRRPRQQRGGQCAGECQVAEWLSLNQDLSLVAATTGLDPFAHDDDEHGLLFINKTGRDDGIRVEAGVLAGPRAGLSYALIVCFDDLSVMQPAARARGGSAHSASSLMEYVF